MNDLEKNEKLKLACSDRIKGLMKAGAAAVALTIVLAVAPGTSSEAQAHGVNYGKVFGAVVLGTVVGNAIRPVSQPVYVNPQVGYNNGGYNDGMSAQQRYDAQLRAKANYDYAQRVQQQQYYQQQNYPNQYDPPYQPAAARPQTFQQNGKTYIVRSHTVSTVEEVGNNNSYYPNQ